jgi:hypothetical protein
VYDLTFLWEPPETTSHSFDFHLKIGDITAILFRNHSKEVNCHASLRWHDKEKIRNPQNDLLVVYSPT